MKMKTITPAQAGEVLQRLGKVSSHLTQCLRALGADGVPGEDGIAGELKYARNLILEAQDNVRTAEANMQATMSPVGGSVPVGEP